jgi:hypothetical protein
MNHRQQSASDFAHFVKGLGFRVFLAGSGDYGFITDTEGSRVLSFSFTGGSSLSGNYGPPSRACGTGWQSSFDAWNIKTADDVSRALYENPPSFCPRAQPGKPESGWQYFTTLEQHLSQYGSSSKYREI